MRCRAGQREARDITRSVGADVFATVPYPDFLPVTVTVIVLPLCADVGVNDDVVAAAIAFPDAYHWYVNVIPAVHVPREATSFFPTAGVPVIVGVRARVTFGDSADVFVSVS